MAQNPPLAEHRPLFTDVACPFEKMKIAADRPNRDYDRSVFLYTIHDGNMIPAELWAEADGRLRRKIEASFVKERDWGANAVATRLAEKLGLYSYHRVNLARCVMDYGRFPGISPPDVNHLTRLAINPPFDELGRGEIQKILNYYDLISQYLEACLTEKLPDESIGSRELIQLAVHTYDERNRSGTRRPAVSLILQPHTYRDQARLSSQLFDPLFPHLMAEFTADRTLAYRLASTLERVYIPVGINFPYPLPEGSVELRSQVWFFFRYLKNQYHSFLKRDSCTPDADTLRFVWNMLLNPNRRDMHGQVLWAYLHDYKKIPKHSELINELALQKAELVYESIQRFLHKNGEESVNAYRFSACRPSSLAIEVRKDWLTEGVNTEEGFRPERLREERVEEIAVALSEAIRGYLDRDLVRKKGLERTSRDLGEWAQRF